MFSHTTSPWPHLSHLWNDPPPWRDVRKSGSALTWKTSSKCVFLAKVALKCCLTLCVVGKVVCLFYNNQHIRRMAFNSVNTGERVCVFMWRDCGRIYTELQVACFSCYTERCFLRLAIGTASFLSIAFKPWCHCAIIPTPSTTENNKVLPA